MSGLPPVFVEFLGKSSGVKMAMADVRRESRRTADETESSFSRFGRVSKAAVMGIGVAAAGAAAATVHMAADFQTQMTRVRTGAGEAAGNMKLVGDGVLAMAGQVGQSTSQLTSGLYLVESAGYHGANALTVLKTAAQGAKVGAADLGTTADALTTAMNAYKMSSSQATSAMNALIATEGQGKTNLEALAGSMASILPTAAAAHVGLNEVLGAMATMTSQGTPAAVAATYLRQTIGMLSNPSGKAAQEMKSLGLSAVDVSKNLGKNGLASTLTMLTDAIEKHMGPAGTVLIAHLQAAAKNTTAYQKVLANLPPAQQTYIGALATMVGGTKSMQAALELTGPHMKDFQANTKTIAEHVKAGGKQVEGWSAVQHTFNQRMAEAKAGVQAMGIQIGNALLPAVTQLAGMVASATTWLTRHKQVAEALAIVIGGALVFALAAVTAQLYAMAAAAAVDPLTWIVLAVVAVIAALVLLAMHWRQVWGAIKSVAETIGKAVAGAWDLVVAATEQAWGAVSDAVTSAWNSVVAFLDTAWHTVADPIVHAWQLITTTTTVIWNGIVAFFRKWWPLLLVIFLPGIGLLISIWNHFHTQIMAAVHTVWNAVLSFLKGIWDAMKAVADTVWRGIQVVILQPMTAVWHSLQSLWRTVSGWLAAAWAAIRRTAGMLWGEIKTAMIDPVTSALRTLTGLMGRIAAEVSKGLHSALNAVKDVGSWFLQIGKDIVSGIVKGVEDSGGALVGSLKHLAGGALHAAKSFLGIGSPSKEFANQVGQWIPHGVAQGVDQYATVAHQAIRRMSAGLLGAGAVTMAGAAGTASLGLAGAGAPAAGTTVVYNITVQGSVIREQELFDSVLAQAQRYKKRNPTTGLT